MLAMGVASYVIREGVIKGNWDEIREEMESSRGASVVRETVDRGGFMFFLNPYVNCILKVGDALSRSAGGPSLKDVGLLPSKLRLHDPLTPLAGPAWGLVRDLERLITPTNQEQWIRTAKRLSPYNNVFWIDAALRRLYDF